jgi:TP901 family phage tail tape measure protein
MADTNKEARLNLVITARDEAKQVLQEMVASVESSLSGIRKVMLNAFPAGDVVKKMSSIATTASESTKGVAESVASMESTLKEAFTATSSMMNEFASAFRSSTNSVRGSTREMAVGVSQDFKDIQKSAHQNSADTYMAYQSLGDGMKHFGHVVGEGFKYAIEQAAEFDGNIQRVSAVLTPVGKVTSDQLKQMGDSALQMGMQSKFGANEILGAMYNLARQGLSATQILGDGVNGAIQVTNALAMATDSDLTETATVVTDVMHEFGVGGEQLKVVADMISGAMHNSSISMNDFLVSMRQVGPVASNMHQNVEDVSAALALLAQHGIKGSQAGTALKNMLLGLEPRTKKATELMQELGISGVNGAKDSFYALDGTLKPLPDILGVLNDKFGGLNDRQKQAALATTFTKYGLAGLDTVVTQTKDSFQEFEAELKKDDIYTISKIKMDSLQGDIWKLHAATQTLAKAFGETLRPVMRELVTVVGQVAHWFFNLNEHTRHNITMFAGIASAVLVTMGTFITFGLGLEMIIGKIGSLATFLKYLLSPIRALSLVFSPVGLAIGAIVIAVYEFAKAWESNTGNIREKTKAFADTVSKKFHELVDDIKPYWERFTKAVGQAMDDAKPVVLAVLGAIKDALNSTAFQKLEEGAKAIAKLGANAAIAHPDVTLLGIALMALVGPKTLVLGSISAITTAVGAMPAIFEGTLGAIGLFGRGAMATANGASAVMKGTFNGIATAIEAPAKGFAKLESSMATMKATGGLTANVFGPMKNTFRTIGIEASLMGTKVMNGINMFSLTNIKAWATSFGSNMIKAFSFSNIIRVAQGAFTGFIRVLTIGFRALLGPWGLIITAVIFGVGALISHWDQVKKWVTDHFGKNFPATLSAFKDKFVAVFQKIGQFFSEVWSFIKQTVTDVFNYVAPFVEGALKKIGTFWSENWGKIKQLFKEVMIALGVILGPALAVLYTLISGALGFIKGIWHDAWSVIKSVVKTVFDAIAGVIRIAWDLISGIISVALDILTGHWGDAWHKLLEIGKNLWNDITSFFGNLGSDMWNFGKNLIHMFVDGIKSMVHAVGDAVSGIANKIKGFLGFHSPAREGPAGRGESDRWMPNLMDMLVTGINDNQGKVQKAVANVALGIKTGINASYQHVNNLNNQPMVHVAPSSGKSPINVHINVDGRSAKTDKAIAEEIAKQFRTQMNVVSG